jgi:rhodanese-related sulfurtransferase
MRPFGPLPALVFSLLSCVCASQSTNTIGAQALKAEIDKGGIQLVDVRTPQEWSTGHIEGAKHIDWFSDDFKTEVAKLDKDGPVRLYCAAGGRSEEAREMLRNMGFKDVLDLEGGMSAWRKAGAPVVK